jgi:AcrR family transcriptional regulator
MVQAKRGARKRRAPGQSRERRAPGQSRERLLNAAIEHVAEHGIGEASLRQLAAALGTSHRMLIYHFGSREGLLLEVVRRVEERQRQAVLGGSADAGASFAEAMRANWRRLAEPSLRPLERLFFEVYGQALQGNPYAAPMLEGVVDEWLRPLTELYRREGFPATTARAEARLGLAVVRGLLLDLLATGDRAGVDAAVERFIARYDTSGSGSASSQSSARR